MKKFLFSIFVLGLTSSTIAGITNIVKPKGYTRDDESEDGFYLVTTKGKLYIYFPGLSERDSQIMDKAIKNKSCLQITEIGGMFLKVKEVKCPSKLKPIKQFY
ncbi:hypothetical protein A1D25_04595 [Ursidibacter arcticus]|uniref:hypothetical protein n=1 Tax=Ursidibacter arcticus TaxID=1524965 RepID=UPI0012FC0D68|nr:hypothetical protein [Ursidibacter arcticus]KAE9535528.1 hypothetical protein A1D25_04595 [Ursidibacter arcticus]